ncbi:MAG: porin family protein [Sediminibacterium sp.]|nr:porin family protein [Sediminibacterium sp.]
MRKYWLLMAVFSVGFMEFASAQVIISPGYPRGGYGRSYPSRQPRRIVKRQLQPKFDPVVHLSLGYGFPNLDANELAGFYNYYRGPVTQTGPITGAIDVQYSRSSSIGLMVTHGQVSANYFNYNNSTTPAMNGSLDNWSVMLNLMNYAPTNGIVAPYLRTAIGLNVWKQDYTDANGNKMGYLSDLNQFAYQVGLGVNIHLSKSTGIFMEGGYGKYIVHGGLSFKL